VASQLTREYVLDVLRQQGETLRQQFHVKRIGIFGSVARNEATDKSDIDFVVEFDIPLEAYIKNKYSLGDYLRELFGREVDLANPNSLKPFYKDIILSETLYA
jgi:predicted nucleotidyltransferase